MDLKIKNLFPYFLLLSLVSGMIGCNRFNRPRLQGIEELERRPSVKNDDNRLNLTCQRRVFIAAGRGSKWYKPLYKDYFAPVEEVWVALDPIYFKNGQKARFYVVEHKEGGPDEINPLKDVSGGYEVMELKPEAGKCCYVLVWREPKVREEGYDVVVDLGCDGFYNKGRDLLDTGNKGGFYVPENWICVENVTFNHTKDSICCDALTIKIKKKKPIDSPEWRREKRPLPVAYIAGTPQVTVNTAFLAANQVKLAKLEVVTQSGSLSGLMAKTIWFKKSNTILHKINILPVKNRSSESFQLSGGIPELIHIFDQEWKWYLRGISLRDEGESGEFPGRIHIATTVNRIYIVLDVPRCPWEMKGKYTPWVPALDISCRAAKGKTDKEEAAAEIARFLYKNPYLTYHPDSEFFSSNANVSSSFKLAKFLKIAWPVDEGEKESQPGDVNCYDMGKAVVIFSNILGCGLELRHIIPEKNESFEFKEEIIMIGGNLNGGTFKNHAFATRGKNVFDASLKVVLRDYAGIYREEWMVNVPLAEYMKKLLKRWQPIYPEIIPVRIE